jgi:hypothetical protein
MAEYGWDFKDGHWLDIEEPIIVGIVPIGANLSDLQDFTVFWS